MSSSIEQNRLDRIETKIDKLAETVVQMARAEEKLVVLEEGNKILMQELTHVQEKILIVEKTTDANAQTIKVASRFFWIAIAAAITAIVGMWVTSHFHFTPINQQQLATPTTITTPAILPNSPPNKRNTSNAANGRTDKEITFAVEKEDETKKEQSKP